MSHAEARSWWADVQHLRPDAPTASAVLDAPGFPARDALRVAGPNAARPADRDAARATDRDAARAADPHIPGAADRDPARAADTAARGGVGTRGVERASAGDPLLAPAPGRRFVRAPETAGRSQREGADHVMGAAPLSDGSGRRRIVLLRDDTPVEEAPVRDAAAVRRAAATDGAGLRASLPRDVAAASPTVTDVDFDFGRAAEARARRRTAERLASSPGERSRVGAPAPTSGATNLGGRGAPASASAPLAAPSAPLAQPPARGGVLGQRGASPMRVGRGPRRSRIAHMASQPDRIALWAVVLGILLVALAAASSRADAATHRVAPLERTALVSAPQFAGTAATR